MSDPLAGRGALVTGVSRRAGIGYAIARPPARARRRRRSSRASSPHDAAPAVGRRPRRRAGAGRRARGAGQLERDFTDPAAPAACVAAAAAPLGHVDILVANHAMSCDQDLEALEAAAIDATLAVNVRGTLLLVQAYAARHDDARPGGRVVLFTSGPAPRADDARAALRGEQGRDARASRRRWPPHLAPRGILVNTINPGPTDTGWATPELIEHELRRLPLGRWGAPGGRGPARRLARERRGGVDHRPGAHERRRLLAEPRLSQRRRRSRRPASRRNARRKLRLMRWLRASRAAASKSVAASVTRSARRRW